MTYAKGHFLVFRYLERGVTRFLSVRKFAKTRWIGLLIQAEKLIKAETDIKEKANHDNDLKDIVEGLDWQVVKEWLKDCELLKVAVKNTQLSRKPNIHLVVLDSIKIFKGALKKTDSSPSNVHVDIIAFNRYLC